MRGLLKVAEVSDSATMVALLPPESWVGLLKPHASRDQFVDGLHMTLVYLGELTDQEATAAVEAVEAVANWLDPITLKMNGAGTFRNDQNVRFVIPNGPGLDEWRYKVRDECDEIMEPATHGFVPHITLEYHDDMLPDMWETVADQDFEEWICDTMYVIRGNEVLSEHVVGQ